MLELYTWAYCTRLVGESYLYVQTAMHNIEPSGRTSLHRKAMDTRTCTSMDVTKMVSVPVCSGIYVLIYLLQSHRTTCFACANEAAALVYHNPSKNTSLVFRSMG